MRIHSGTEKPEKAFAAVRYRDHWFWVEESDWHTKRALTAVMFFFTLADTGGRREAAADHHPGAVNAAAVLQPIPARVLSMNQNDAIPPMA